MRSVRSIKRKRSESNARSNYCDERQESAEFKIRKELEE